MDYIHLAFASVQQCVKLFSTIIIFNLATIFTF